MATVSMKAQTNPTAQDAIESRFVLSALRAIKPDHGTIVYNLIQNGLYYLTVDNVVSALASFSSAATYVYALQMSDPSQTSALEATMLALLGYVETLQNKTKGMRSGGSGSGGAAGKEDEKDDWDIECETMMEEDESKNCLTFKGVVGMAKEKQVFFDAITNPLLYPNLYTKAAKGILLYGPPGTGKTFLVKAAIRELGIRFDDVKVLFFALTGADLKGKYVGETEKKIARAYTCASRRACQMTDLYNKTGPKKLKKSEATIAGLKEALIDRKHLPKDADSNTILKNSPQFVSVIFIDEFDAVGGDRSKDETGMVANAVNTLLQMMDGVDTKKNVITVCATNFPWNLDSALLRRFSEQVYCNVPNFEDIKRLVQVEMKNRFMVSNENKLEYCGTKLTKTFDPSEELAKLYPKTGEKKKSCDDDTKKPSVLDYIDEEYMKDSSLEMMAVVSEMAEGRYSNSDVSSVMQKAFNAVSESALKSTLWIQVEHGEATYWVSRLTQFKEKEKTGRFAETMKSLAKIETCAGQRTEYVDMVRTGAASPSAAAAAAAACGDTNVLEIPESIYMDEETVSSIFPDERSVEEKKAEKERQLTSLVLNGKTYTNVRYINELPTALMFNDRTIADMFYNATDVMQMKQMVEQSKRTKKMNKEYEIDVVFSKVMNVEYKGTQKRTDTIDAVFRKHLETMNELDYLIGSYAGLLAEANALDASGKPDEAAKKQEEADTLWATREATCKDLQRELFYTSNTLAVYAGNLHDAAFPTLKLDPYLRKLNLLEPARKSKEDCERGLDLLDIDEAERTSAQATELKAILARVLPKGASPPFEESVKALEAALDYAESTLNTEHANAIQELTKLKITTVEQKKEFLYGTYRTLFQLFDADEKKVKEYSADILQFKSDLLWKSAEFVRDVLATASVESGAIKIQETTKLELLKKTHRERIALAESPSSAVKFAAILTLEGIGKALPTIQDYCITLLNSEGVLNFMSPELSRHTIAILEKTTEPETALQNDFATAWFACFKELSTKTELKELEEKPSSAYKVFYFKSTIKPFKGDWVRNKAGGLGKQAYDAAKGLLDGAFSGIKSLFGFGDDASKKQELVNSIAARMAKANVSASKYLLVRATGVGVCEGADDRAAYRIQQKSVLELTKGYERPVATPSATPSVTPSSLRGVTPKNKGGKKGGVYKYTLKASRNPPTERVDEVLESQTAQEGGGNHYSKLHWFMLKGFEEGASDTVNMKDVTKTIASSYGSTESSSDAPTSWNRFKRAGAWAAKTVLVAASVGATGALVAVTGGLALGALPLVGVGLGLTSMTMGGMLLAGGAAGALLGGAGMALYGASDAVADIAVNDLFGSFFAFENPEEDVYIVNLMLASMFTGDSLELPSPPGEGQTAGTYSLAKEAEGKVFDWKDNFSKMFSMNYQKALDTRKRYFAQHARYPNVTYKNTVNSLNLKIVRPKSKVDKVTANFLSFYMDPSYIGAAIKSYPSTYNANTGKMLEDYNKDRSKFLTDLQEGKYDKKK